MRWDLFCRVIDNYGDVGVCWRLAADLASRGEAVRLWLDDASALAWMAPRGASGVDVRRWADCEAQGLPGDVVVEAFGCDPPASFVARMAGRASAPVWINLEYLSAEAYVERSHGLMSPQMAGPGRGLAKWFFYPGFSVATGGLIREAGLSAAQSTFDRRAWLAARGITLAPDERVVTLFCYPGAPVPSLLQAVAAPGAPPVLLLPTPGAATEAATLCTLPPGVRIQPLPWLDQGDFDRLLWSGDINLVRGEDSFVRAMWAARPFLWHIYPQHDGAHHAKLAAFLDLFGAGGLPGLADAWRVWNGLQSGPLTLPDPGAWQAACQRWKARLLVQQDLTSRLLDFVHEHRAATSGPATTRA